MSLRFRTKCFSKYEEPDDIFDGLHKAGIGVFKAEVNEDDEALETIDTKKLAVKTVAKKKFHCSYKVNYKKVLWMLGIPYSLPEYLI